MSVTKSVTQGSILNNAVYLSNEECHAVQEGQKIESKNKKTWEQHAMDCEEKTKEIANSPQLAGTGDIGRHRLTRLGCHRGEKAGESHIEVILFLLYFIHSPLLMIRLLMIDQ